MSFPRQPNLAPSAETLVLAVAVLGTGMVYLDQTALNVALPALQESLDAGIGGIQWIIDSYILTLSSLMLLGGVLGDRYGRVRVYVIGMVVFVAASIGCGFAQNVEQMIAARLIQGIGGALVVPGGLALVNAAVDVDRRGRVIGTWAMLTSMVVALGPTLGGWLVDTISWRMVFFINVPLGLGAIMLGVTRVPESRNPNLSGRLDWLGAITLLFGLMGLLFGLIEGPRLGWGEWLVVGSLLGGIVLLGLFVWVEARALNPILPLALFRHREFCVINLLTLVHWIAINALFFFFPIVLQQAYGYSALQAGMALLPISAMIVLLSRWAGVATDRVGAPRLIVVGIGLTAVAFGLLASLDVAENYWGLLLPITLAYGLGLGVLIAPLTSVAMGALPSELSGLASGVNNAAARLAGMLSIAIFGSVLAWSFGRQLAARLPTAGLPSNLQQRLLADADSLGAMQVPAELAGPMAETVQQMIRDSLSDSFQFVMSLCVAISVLSLVIWFRR